MQTDTYKHKLESLLRGLQCQNIKDLIEKDALFLFIFGATMANMIKNLKAKAERNKIHDARRPDHL